MEFLGVGYQELLLVLGLLLVVVGPERLPTVAYQIGRAVRQMQRYARAVRDEFSDEIGYIEEQYRTVKGEVDTTRESLRQQQERFNAELREVAPPLELPALQSPHVATSGASEGGFGASENGSKPADDAAIESLGAEGASPAVPPLVF